VGLAVGCALFAGGPFVSPRIAGQVVDDATGAPVAGATVFVWYEASVAGTIEHSGGGFGSRWVETDAEGRFEFPSEVLAKRVPGGLRVDTRPAFQVVHPKYGSDYPHLPDNPAEWGDAEIRIEPSQRTLDDIRHGESAICGGPRSQESYDRCCQALWGLNCKDVRTKY